MERGAGRNLVWGLGNATPQCTQAWGKAEVFLFKHNHIFDIVGSLISSACKGIYGSPIADISGTARQAESVPEPSWLP